MATPWPEDQTWPIDYREHVTKLSTYVRTALASIDTANGTPIDPRKVRAALLGSLSLILKVQGTPDFGHIRDEIRSAQIETKTTTEDINKAITDIREELRHANKITRQTVASVQENVNIARAVSATAKEAMEVSKTTMKMVRDMKPTGAPSQSTLVQTYATIAARGGLAGSMHNPVNHRTSPIQAQREIIINI